VAADSSQPVFYYDLADPYCYVAAERIMGELGQWGPVPEWEPVHGGQLGWRPARVEPDTVARFVAEHGLQPLRLPRRWPPDSRAAMLAATFAKSGGRAVAFSLAAFRQAFAGGRDLSEEGTVLIAAAACEMHPRAVLKGMEMRSVAASLQRAGERAAAAGVRALPAIQIGADLFAGRDALDEAVTALAAGAAPAG
jgi:2-hydroxychromene-2-carboxylate isomerase